MIIQQTIYLLKKEEEKLSEIKENKVKDNNDEEDYPITIIAEETDKECSQNPMLKSNNNSVYKNSVNSKTKILNDIKNEHQYNFYIRFFFSKDV